MNVEINAGRPVPIKIFATDVHRESLDFAGVGVYRADSLGGLNPERLGRYFVPRGAELVGRHPRQPRT